MICIRSKAHLHVNGATGEREQEANVASSCYLLASAQLNSLSFFLFLHTLSLCPTTGSTSSSSSSSSSLTVVAFFSTPASLYKSHTYIYKRPSLFSLPFLHHRFFFCPPPCPYLTQFLMIHSYTLTPLSF